MVKLTATLSREWPDRPVYLGIAGAIVTSRTQGAAPRQRMMRTHGRRQTLALNMGVDLGGRNIRMTEH
jgi:hypothetical protein